MFHDYAMFLDAEQSEKVSFDRITLVLFSPTTHDVHWEVHIFVKVVLRQFYLV